jgi:hypothetical protein
MVAREGKCESLSTPAGYKTAWEARRDEDQWKVELTGEERYYNLLPYNTKKPF